jgi:hypothetical protein
MTAHAETFPQTEEEILSPGRLENTALPQAGQQIAVAQGLLLIIGQQEMRGGQQWRFWSFEKRKTDIDAAAVKRNFVVVGRVGMLVLLILVMQLQETQQRDVMILLLMLLVMLNQQYRFRRFPDQDVA